MASEVTRTDLEKPHLPRHRTFKTRPFLISRDFGRAWKMAEDAITRGDKAIMDALAAYASEEERKDNEWKDPELPGKSQTIHTEQDDLISPEKVADGRAVDCNGGVDTPTAAPSSEASIHSLQAPATANSQPSTAVVALSWDSSPNPAEPMELETKPTTTDVETRAETDPGSERSRPISVLGLDLEDLCYRCNQKLSSPCWYCIDCIGVLPCLSLLFNLRLVDMTARHRLDMFAL
jgi:hypothetical protein